MGEPCYFVGTVIVGEFGTGGRIHGTPSILETYSHIFFHEYFHPSPPTLNMRPTDVTVISLLTDSTVTPYSLTKNTKIHPSKGINSTR